MFKGLLTPIKILLSKIDFFLSKVDQIVALYSIVNAEEPEVCSADHHFIDSEGNYNDHLKSGPFINKTNRGWVANCPDFKWDLKYGSPT